MNHTEKTKINNFKAQYVVVLGNINDANKTLEEVFKKRKEAEDALSKILSDILLEAARFSNISARNTATQSATSDAIDDLHQKIEGVKAFEKESTQRIEEGMRGFELARNESYSSIEKRKGEIKELTDRENSLIYEVEEMQEKAGFLSEEYKSLKKDKSDLVSLMTQLEESRQEKVVLSEKETLKREVLLADLQEEIRKNVTSIKAPMENLSQREERLVEKERNFQILTLRWKRFFAEHFPGQELKL